MTRKERIRSVLSRVEIGDSLNWAAAGEHGHTDSTVTVEHVDLAREALTVSVSGPNDGHFRLVVPSDPDAEPYARRGYVREDDGARPRLGELVYVALVSSQLEDVQ